MSDPRAARQAARSGDFDLLRAMRRQPVSRTPIWIMRQAGRYLPEYRQVRERAGSFLDLLKDPVRACEVTLQPLRRFDLDAAILFSDILTIPDAMGLGLHFVEGEGPRFHHPVRDAAAIAALPDMEVNGQLGYVFETVERVKSGLANRTPLIGFSGSPWTLATYMVQGASSREFEAPRTLLYGDPDALLALLDKLSRLIVDYLLAQIHAGVDAVMLFDTWGGLLTPAAYRRFSLEPMQRIIETLRARNDSAQVPVVLFTKGGGNWLEWMVESGADVLGLDWSTDIAAARQRTGNAVALQGNLDPAVLRAPQDAIRDAVAAVLDGFGTGSGHVFNLGHGITPDIDPDRVAYLVDTVHDLSRAYHR